MIDEIHVQNLALIRDARLCPSSGLTVITGETGAGKTALLSALKLLIGERADSSSVREGAAALCVEGRFFEQGAEEGVVVTRQVGVDGRSRASIDGAMSSVRELADRVGSTVDLCGQHEHQQLLNTFEHLRVLDAWAEHDLAQPRERYREAFSRAADAAAELARIQEASRSSAAQLDEAQFTLRRIDELNPQEGEYEELAARLSQAEHADALVHAADTTYRALSGEDGALDLLASAVAELESMASVEERFAEQAASLRDAAFVLEDVSREALSYRDSIDFDAEQLAADQERMGALQGLLRSYGPRMEDVFARRAEAAELVALATGSEEQVERAQAVLDQAESALAEAARELDELRRREAPRFAAEVTAQMARLEMGSASIECAFTELERSRWTAESPSRMEFLFRPAEGMSARPLVRIASGGEVSRVMLAVKTVLGAADEVETLVFDEVDAGVGGSTAVALAALLADLATTHQVIVVTHLPQIAVMGDVHYQVCKREAAAGSDDLLPETELIELQGDDRVAEIARMLSGDDSEVSHAHAKELLEHARQRR